MPHKARLPCRIPLSSCHPQIPTWCLNKPRLLIMNRADMVSQQDQQDWSNYYGRQGLSVYYTDANAGKGVTKVVLPIVESLMTKMPGASRRNCIHDDIELASTCCTLAQCTLHLTMSDCYRIGCQCFLLASDKRSSVIIRTARRLAQPQLRNLHPTILLSRDMLLQLWLLHTSLLPPCPTP